MANTDKINELIKNEIRENLNIDLIEISKEAGLGYYTLHRYLAGLALTIPELKQISNYFRVDYPSVIWEYRKNVAR